MHMQRIESGESIETPPRVAAWDALPFALSYLVLAILVNASIQGGLHILIPFLLVVALGDLAFGLRTTNFDTNAPPRALLLHHVLLWLWCPAQIGVLVFVLWQVLVVGHLSTLEIVALTYIIGKSCVSGMAVGHELVHRPRMWERLLGEALLSSFAYSHYRTEHVYVHHAHVGTPNDPVFARKGQSAWSFMPRAMFGNVARSLRFERDKLRRRGVGPWHYSNPFWRYGALMAVWLILVWSFGEAGPFGGWIGIAIYLVYSAFAMMILRLIDYVEHYGLSRKILPNGRFERVEPRHSWNASHRISNWVTWNVQRHSDHHHRPVRAYPLLQHYGTDLAPQLPTSYMGMFLAAIVPPLWFRLIDPRVDAWRQRFYPEIDNWRPYESELYLSRSDKLPVIAEVMESPRLGDWIEAQPSLLDSLDRPEFENLTVPEDLGLDVEQLATARQGLVKLYYTREIDFGELHALTVDSEEPQHIMDIVDTAREWMNVIVFQAAVHTLRGNLDPRLLVSTLSRVVDTVLDVLLQSNATKFGDDLPALRDTGYAIIAFGRLGRRRAGFDSTLEVALVHDAPDQDTEARETIRRLAERLFRSLRALVLENFVFAGVARPAQTATSGPFTVGEVEERFGNDAAGFVALAEARAVCGDADLIRRFEDERRRLLSAQASSTDVQRRLAATRSRNVAPGREASGLAFLRELDPAPGGFADLRLAAAYSAMLDAKHGTVSADAGIDDFDGPFAAAAARGEIDEAVAGELGAVDALWRRLRAVLPFTPSRRLGEEKHTAALHRFVASSCGAESLDDLVGLANESCSRASACVDELLGAG